MRGGAEAVLNIKSVAVFVGMANRVARVLEAAVDVPGQKVLQRSAECAAVKFQLAAEVFVEKLLNAGAIEIDAKLHIVFIELPRKIIDQLIVGIEAVAWIAGTGAELGEAAAQRNDRYAFAHNPAAGVETDRTGEKF